MKTFRLLILLSMALAATEARAAFTNIYALVTFTNMVRGTTNGDTITVNSSVRTYTNTVSSSPSTLIRSTNSVGWSATNTLTQLATWRAPGTDYLYATNTNAIVISGVMTSNLTVTLSAGVGTVSYVTQAWDRLFSVNYPEALIPTEAGRTNNASGLFSVLNSSKTTNSVNNGSVGFTNYLDRTSSQEAGNKSFTNSTFQGRLTNSTGFLTNGLYHGGLGTNIVFTNSHFNGEINATSGWVRGLVRATNFYPISMELVPYGPSVSLGKSTNSPFINFYSRSSNAVVQIRADTNGFPSMWDAAAPYDDTVLIDPSYYQSIVNWFSVLNYVPTKGTNLLNRSNQWDIINVWSNSLNRFDLGVTVSSNLFAGSARLTNANIYSPTNFSTNLTAYGGSISNAHVRETVVSNAVFSVGATNVWNGDVSYTRTDNSSIANGNNAGVLLGTNTFVALSGGSTIATIAGFAAERNGSFKIVKISGAVTNIIANQSGVEPTAANRIVTGTGGDLSLTNQPAFITIIYDSSASRWNVISFSR